MLSPVQNLIILENDDVKDDGIEKDTYCYVSPQGCWKDDFDYRTETFESYASMVHPGRKLFGRILKGSNRRKAVVTRKMNYDIKID